jgi:hypothetical protein
LVYFDQVLYADPQYIAALGERGETFLAIGKIEYAMKDFEKVCFSSSLFAKLILTDIKNGSKSHPSTVLYDKMPYEFTGFSKHRKIISAITGCFKCPY